jgi:hypothetical protein
MREGGIDRRARRFGKHEYQSGGLKPQINRGGFIAALKRCATQNLAQPETLLIQRDC